MLKKTSLLALAIFVVGLAASAQPVISDVRIDGITHSTARITWKTDVAASTQIEFGASASYGYTTGEVGDRATTHAYFLSGLAPSMTYHFRPVSRTSAGVANAPYSDMTLTTAPEPAVHPAQPEAPRRRVDVTMPTQTGNIWNVEGSCTNLQALLDSPNTKLGDTIVIPAGTTCTGNYHLPAKTEGTGWIVIRTSTPDSQLPPDTRVTAASAPLMATIRTPKTGMALYRDAISTDPGAHHYRLIGIQFTHTSTATTADTDPEPFWRLATVNTDAHHVIFDRCYFHGLGYPNRLRTAMYLDGSDVALIHSRIDNVNNWVPNDLSSIYYNEAAFGVIVDNGPGVGLVEDNYFDVVGLPMFITDNYPNAPPADYEIKHNHFFMPEMFRQGSPSSDGHRYVNRSNIEMKRGVRVSIDANLFENQWSDSTMGSVILLYSQYGGYLGQNASMISDITITNNIIRNAGNGVVIFSHPSMGTGNTLGTHNVRIANNIFDSINGYSRVSQLGNTKTGTAGLAFAVYAGAEDVTIEHNTIYNNRGMFPVFLAGGSEWSEGLRFENNILWWNRDMGSNHTGMFWEGIYGQSPAIPFTNGTAVFEGGWRCIPSASYIFRRNLMVPGVYDKITSNLGSVDLSPFIPVSPSDVASPKFPWDNLWSTSVADAGLGDTASGDFGLSPSSRFRGQGSDGRDPGVDMAALRAAQALTVQVSSSSAPVLTLSASPVAQSVQAGNPASYAVTLGSSSTTSLSTASISASVSQPGVTASLSSPTISTTSPVTLNLATTTATAAGTYTVTITTSGTAGSQSATVSLTVTAPAPKSYATTIATNPAGIAFSVDGVSYSAGTSLNWAADSTHTISASAPAASAGQQFVFQGWSDGGAQSHAVTARGAATYTATYLSTYQLATAVQGSGSIAVSPTSATGYYPASSTVTLRAVPAAGSCFTGWANLPSATPDATVMMTQPYNVTAKFQPGTVGLNNASLQPSGNGGSYIVLVKANAGCAWKFNATVPWVRLRSTPPADGSANVLIAVDPNVTGATRSTVVYFGPAALTITQKSK